MRKYIFSLLIFILATSTAYAQPALSDANITGHIKSKKDGEHIPFATIRLLNTQFGASTDATGHYFLKNLPIGEFTIEASCMGYLPQTQHVRIKKDHTIEINFELAEDMLQLEQIVVTSNKSDVKRRNSSSLVNVLGAQTFQMASATCLADGLKFQPGVRVENDCQNCGFTQVRINGLDGHYSQILMNSRPVFSALTGVYGLEQIPANMIDRVEVMRGGGSALFGSSAIGGTINIITKDPTINSAEISNTTMSIGMSSAIDNNITLNASLVTDNQKLGLFIFGQNRIRNAYDHDGDGFSEIPKLRSQTLGARAFMRPSQNTRFTLEYRGTSEFRRGGDNVENPPHTAQIAEQTDHSINSGDASFNYWTDDYKHKINVFASMQDTKRDSYYGSNKDVNAYGKTSDLVAVTGAQYTLNFKNLWFMPAEFVSGLEYNYNYLHDVTLGYNHDVTQRVHIFSGYLQNEWRTDKWGFLVGARIDKHSLINKPIISPRANIRFNPSKNMNFRASYSTGFRSPQAYDEDFHVAVVGGERVITILAPNLKQESSNSFSLSGDFYKNIGNIQTNLLIEGFYTDLRDVFALRKLKDLDGQGNIVSERYNGSGAKVWGVIVEAKVAFSSKFSVQGGVTLQKSEYKKPEKWSENLDVPSETKMFRTPDTYGYVTANYSPLKRLQLSLTSSFTGPMLVQHFESSGTPIDMVKRTSTFADINLKVQYDFSIFNFAHLQLNGGMMNIFNSYQNDFDKGSLRDSKYIYGPTLPRSIFVGLKLSI